MRLMVAIVLCGACVLSMAQAPVTRSLDTMNYDAPQNNPANQPPVAVCDPDQLSVRVGGDNEANGHHAVPVAFTNKAAPCSLGGALEVRLENSFPGQRRVPARDGVPAHTEAVVLYRPIPLRSCQNCGDFRFPSSTAQDIVLQTGDTAYIIVGYTSLNAVPCATADTLSWTVGPGAEPRHEKVQMNVCTPLMFSGVLRQLPETVSAP